MNAIKVYEDACRKADNSEITLGEFEKIIEPLMDVEPVIRCKDCKHRPKGTGANHDLKFPDYVCPCQCVDDYWYSWMPNDDWFCADGERKEE